MNPIIILIGLVVLVVAAWDLITQKSNVDANGVQQTTLSVWNWIEILYILVVVIIIGVKTGTLELLTQSFTNAL